MAWALFVIFLLPVIATAFMIGLNPGFEAGGLGPANLNILWLVYAAFHALWFSVLVFERVVPSVEEASKAQERRVRGIKTGASRRV